MFKSMFNISQYLENVSKNLDTHRLNNNVVADIITKHTGITKDKIYFNIENGVLKADVSPAEKTMLFIKKEAILHDLNSFYIKNIR